jgi:hypothetical protein
MLLRSDNVAGVSPEILAAVSRNIDRQEAR